MRQPSRRSPRPPASGGRGGWEPRSRIRAREQRVVALAIQGWTQHAIAADVRVSQAAVSKILARVDERLLQELSARVERQKVRQTQRLEYLYTEALHAWEQSKGDTTRRRQRQSEPAGGVGRGQTVAEIEVSTQHGDPRFLDEGRKALADLRKLWGIEAPRRSDVHVGREPFADLSDEELHQRICQLDALIDRSSKATEPTAAPSKQSSGRRPATRR